MSALDDEALDQMIHILRKGTIQTNPRLVTFYVPDTMTGLQEALEQRGLEAHGCIEIDQKDCIVYHLRV